MGIHFAFVCIGDTIFTALDGMNEHWVKDIKK